MELDEKLTRSMGQLCADAITKGLPPRAVVAVMRQCLSEMEQLVTTLEPGSATRRALERMRAEGKTSVEDLTQFMADAGATVIVSQQGGMRTIQPDPYREEGEPQHG